MVNRSNPERLRFFFDKRNDRRMDICDSRVAFATENDSTRGLPYQYTVHQALQIMRIHVDGLMKSWPPHSAMKAIERNLKIKFWPKIL